VEAEKVSDVVERNMARAFAEESKAAVRNAAFALKADQEGYPQLARLFRAVADAESVHARRFLLLMRGKIRTTEENLSAAFQNEKGAARDAYPDMVKAAAGASRAVQKAFEQSKDTDEEHVELYQEALKSLLAESRATYYVCQICGHINEDFVPENCPVCGAVSGRFKEVP
jgi:rubrerythrin